MNSFKYEPTYFQKSGSRLSYKPDNSPITQQKNKCQPKVYRTMLRNYYNVSLKIAVGQERMRENFVCWEGNDTCISLMQQYVYIYIFMYVFI